MLLSEDKVSKLEEGKLKAGPVQPATSVASTSANPSSMPEEHKEKFEHVLEVVPAQLTIAATLASAGPHSVPVPEEPKEEIEHNLKVLPVQSTRSASLASAEPNSVPEKLEAEIHCPFSATDKPEDVENSNCVSGR